MLLNKQVLLPITALILLTSTFTLQYYKSKQQNASTCNHQTNSKNTKKESDAEIIIDGATLNAFGYNKVKGCTIHSKKNQIFRDQQKFICENVSCHLTTSNDEIAKLYSPEAQIDQKNKTLIFPKSVSGSFKEFQIQSDSAEYNSNDHKITAQNITLKSKNPTLTITSKECSLDLKNETITLNKNVYSKIEMTK